MKKSYFWQFGLTTILELPLNRISKLVEPIGNPPNYSSTSTPDDPSPELRQWAKKFSIKHL